MEQARQDLQGERTITKHPKTKPHCGKSGSRKWPMSAEILVHAAIVRPNVMHNDLTIRSVEQTIPISMCLTLIEYFQRTKDTGAARSLIFPAKGRPRSWCLRNLVTTKLIPLMRTFQQQQKPLLCEMRCL